MQVIPSTSKLLKDSIALEVEASLEVEKFQKLDLEIRAALPAKD